MISATGRLGFGKAAADTPGGAMKSWATLRVEVASDAAMANPKIMKNSRGHICPPVLGEFSGK
jgi:hypothetical protein